MGGDEGIGVHEGVVIPDARPPGEDHDQDAEIDAEEDQDEERHALEPGGGSTANAAGGDVVLIYIWIGSVGGDRAGIAHVGGAQLGRFGVGEDLWLSRHQVLCLTVTEPRGIVLGICRWRGCAGR